MKITVFTSNKDRHNHLINELSKIASEIFVIQESRELISFPDTSNFKKKKSIKKYFSLVQEAEKKIIKRTFIRSNNKKLNLIGLKFGDLNNINKNYFKEFLKSDIYIVFGSSFIKGELLKFLIKKKTINIHMGISPYYRGSATNFWPFVKNQLQFLGITFMMIDDGVDTGKIIHQFRPNLELGDNVHTVGNKMIRQMIEELNKILINFKKIQPKKQSFKKNICVFKKKDFNQKAIFELKKNMNANIIQKYLNKKNEIDKKFKIVKNGIL